MEPMTALTDAVLAGTGAILAVRLAARAENRSIRARRFWALGIGATATAAAIGGLWHGARHLLDPWAAVALWKATLLAAGLASFAIVAAAAWGTLAPRARRALIVAAVAKALAYAAWMAVRDDFVWVVLDSSTALLAAGLLHAWRWRTPGSPHLVAGVAASLAGGAVQATGDGLVLLWFNHNDIYHLIATGALVLFYLGARRIGDRSAHGEPVS